MKLADKTIETHSRGVIGSNQFTIQQSAKMFNVLSNSLYSDKIMAVVRELNTNAYDSHIAAKNPNPFHVYLPNDADPNFKVRDFGTGLSREDMEKLYTTYGGSNKNTSNDFVGCLGLGSKSPFAYTKSFTSTSYFNGTQYTYIASLNEVGIPTLNLMHSSPTDEPNGLEISFAVKRQDFNEFTQKAIRVLHYFRQKPVIFGGVGVDFKKDYSRRNIVTSGDDWNVCKLNDGNLFPSSYSKINSSVIAIMGNIAYPVDIHHLVGEEKDDGTNPNARIQAWNNSLRKVGSAQVQTWRDFLHTINNNGLFLEIEFGIGELEMDISREGLQYTKDVIKTLKNKVEAIYDTLQKEFSKKIADAKTLVEAIQTYHQLRQVNDWGVEAVWTCPVTKKNHKISNQDLEYKIEKDKALYVFGLMSAGYRSRKLVSMTDKIHMVTLGGSGGSYYYRSGKNPSVFFYSDLKSINVAKRIVDLYANKHNCYAYLIVDTVDHTKSMEGFDDLIRDVGKDKFLKVSDYKDLIVRAANANKGVKKGSVSDQDVFIICGDKSDTAPLTANYGDSNLMHTMTEDRLEDFLDESELVYVPISRYSSVSGYPSVKHITAVYDELCSLFGQKPTIYAIKEKTAEGLAKDTGRTMVNINAWMKEGLTKISKNQPDYFKYLSLFDLAKEEYDKTDVSSYWTGKQYATERQITHYFLRIFGLEYDKFIKNKAIVGAMDSLLLLEFLGEIVFMQSTHMDSKNQKEYIMKIDDILKTNNLTNTSAAALMKNYETYKNFISRIDNVAAGNTELIALVKDIKEKAKKIGKFALPKTDAIRKILKAELDKSPAIRYIMAEVGDLTANIRTSVGKPTFSGGGNGRSDWFSKISIDDNLRKILAGLIS